MNCQKGKVAGISYDGGYAEYMVAPQEALARMPEGLDLVQSAPLMCAGVTTFNALRNSGARGGDLVAVQGLGGLGRPVCQHNGLSDRRDFRRSRQRKTCTRIGSPPLYQLSGSSSG